MHRRRTSAALVDAPHAASEAPAGCAPAHSLSLPPGYVQMVGGTLLHHPSGTAACPPYHLAVVIGGLSAEMNLKTVKLASTRYLDNLPTTGSPDGRAFRDLEWRRKSTR